jgi:CubicO group peptidase (beta-lactamase class C family)
MRRRRLIAVTAGLALLAAVPLAARTSLRVVSGFASSTICSGAFVSGLNPDRVYAETVRPTPGFGWVDPLLHYEVDRGRDEVRTTIGGAFARRAVYRSGLGCMLVDGEPPAFFASAELAADPSTPPLLPEIAGPEVVIPASERLRAALDRAFDEPGGHWQRLTKAVVVVHDGHVIAERYAPGYGVSTPLPGNSATKSVTSALIGVLARLGRISVQAPAPVAVWSDPKDPRHAVTVEHLLRMTAGFPSDELHGGIDESSRMWFLATDMARMAEGATLASSPGSRWAYSDGSYEVLARILRDAVGGDVSEALRFSRRELFDPLGMRSVTFQVDSTGTFTGSKGMFASARDWARFGLLYLEDGVVGGERILPKGWVRMTTSQTLDTGYGAGFWLNVVSTPMPQWRQSWGMPGAPPDAFFAKGYLGQYVVVVPSERLVVARFGVTHAMGGGVQGVGRLVAAAIAAIHEPAGVPGGGESR